LNGYFAIVLLCIETDLPVVAAFQETKQGVVITGGNGVELVIMATGAGHSQAQERFGHDIEAVIEPGGLVLSRIDRRMDLFSQKPKSRAQDRFVKSLRRMKPGPRDQITSKVLGDELVIRNVGIQSANHVIAVMVSIGNWFIILVTAGLGIADQV